MPNYATPGHPYSAQSIYVTVSPVYKKDNSGSNEDDDFRVKPSFSRKLPTLLRPHTGVEQDCTHYQVSPRSPRAKTAPPTYKYPPNLDYTHPLITARYLQYTPWCRDMYRWFTPDLSQGVWYDHEDYDRYRKRAFRTRLPAKAIYHVDSGLMPSYSGYVPGQHFRFGSTWACETRNSRRIGIQRTWESTSFFQDRPIGA